MERVDKIDVGNWVNEFNYNTAEEFLVEILHGKIAIEKMHDSVLQLRSGNLDDATELQQEMYYEDKIEDEWGRHERHMESINKARSKTNERTNI
jgi:archaellum component FlaC